MPSLLSFSIHSIHYLNECVVLSVLEDQGFSAVLAETLVLASSDERWKARKTYSGRHETVSCPTEKDFHYLSETKKK